MSRSDTTESGGVGVRRWWPSRLVIAATLGTVLLATLLIGTPYLLRYLAENWLRGAGAESPHIANVDLNPFSGVVIIEGVQADGDDGRLRLQRASIDIDWWPLLRQRVFVRALAVQGLDADVRIGTGGDVRVGGVAIPAGAADEPDTEPTDWSIGLGGVGIDGAELRIASDDLDGSLTLVAARLGAASQWQPEVATPLHLDLRVNNAALALDAQLWPFAGAPRLTGTLRLDGAGLAPYRPLLADTPLTDLDGRLSAELQLDVSLSQAGALGLDSTGSIRLDALSAGYDGAALSTDSVVINGSTSLRLPAGDDDRMPVFDGSVRLAALALTKPAADASANVPGVGLAVGALELDGLVVRSPNGDTVLHRAAVRDVEIGSAVADGNPVVAVGSLLVGDVSASPARVDVASIDVDSLAVDVVIREDGSIALLQALQSLVPPTTIGGEALDTPEPTAGQAAATAFAWGVGRLAVDGDSGIDITDRSIEPQLQTRLRPLTLTVTDLASDGRPAHVELLAQQGSTSRISVSGQVQPLGGQVSADLAVVLSGLNLPQVSGYVPGYNLEQGRLSVDSKVRIDRDELDVDNRIVIERLKLVARQGTEVPFLSDGLAMPLDVVLDLLRDRDDAIRLRVPVTGNLDAPDFGTGQIVRRALRGALQKAAVSYVKNALQPLGTLVMVGQMAGRAMRPRFEPIVFDPGSDELSPSGEQYVESIGRLLGERPRLSLTLCGVATEADRAALLAAAQSAAPPDAGSPVPMGAQPASTEAAAPPILIEDSRLEVLAEQRADRVRGQLANVHGIAAERLFACLPQVEQGADGEPRVDVVL